MRRKRREHQEQRRNGHNRGISRMAMALAKRTAACRLVRRRLVDVPSARSSLFQVPQVGPAAQPIGIRHLHRLRVTAK